MHPFEMNRVDGIFLALKPVARNFSKHDLAKTVLPCKRFPVRNEWRRIRSQVRPNQTGSRGNRVRLDAHLVFESRLRRGDIVVWLLHTLPGLIEAPAVVIASQPA